MSTPLRSDPPSTWALVVPVKALDRAKTRLATDAEEDLTAYARSALALAFALDTLDAALHCPAVRQVLVVTDDVVVAGEAQGVGAHVVADPGRGLNEALRHGARAAQDRAPGAGVGALLGDLPALRAGDLHSVLTSAAAHPVSAVADADAEGTTLLVARHLTDFDPRFGPHSLRRHVHAGAVLLTDVPAGLRRDVDTAAHLREAVTLGVGARTRDALTAWVS